MTHRNMFDRYLNTKDIKKNKVQYSHNSDSEVEIALVNSKKQPQDKIDIFMDRITKKPKIQITDSDHKQPNVSNNLYISDHRLINPKTETSHPKQQALYNPKQFLSNKSSISNDPKSKGPISSQSSYKNEMKSDLYLLSNWHDKEPKNQPTLQMLKAKGMQQRRAKRLKEKQEKKALAEKRKKENEQQKKQGFSAFMDFVLVDKDKEKEKDKKEHDEGLKNLGIYDEMLDQNQEKIQEGNPRKINSGLIYKKQAIQNEKIPLSFLKILLSYKFSKDFLIPETKKVPNSFSDQLIYKKIFHYLVTNECLADIHLRMKKLQENPGQTTQIPLQIEHYSKNSDGLIEVIMKETLSKSQLEQGKESFQLKNLWLSKNRIGIVSNQSNFKLQNYGINSDLKTQSFYFLCYLQSPQSKQELQCNVKALASFEMEQLDMIKRQNKSMKAYFYDLEKISTHIREYMAITHLYETQLAPLIYNPQLIDKKHYNIIKENERQKIEPILQCLSHKFNKTQFESIREMVIRDEGIVLLQGPPGTGKTTTLMGLLAAEYHYLKFINYSQDQTKILICAPSNAAIDHITKRLVCEGLTSVDGCQIFPNILRVGIVESEDSDIRSVSIDDICDKKVLLAKQNIMKKNNMTTIQIKEKLMGISKEINQIKKKQISNPDLQNQLRIKNLRKQSKEYESMLYHFRKQKLELKQLYLQEENKLLQQADIILTTLSSSGSDKMDKLRGYIGCLIIDEAAQSTQPNLLIPLQSFVNKVLLIGDPCQLPATTMSQDSQITLFNRSLFQRFIDAGVKPYFLNIQYRMAPPIREFASKCFYDGRLLDAEEIINRYKDLEIQKIQTNEYSQKSKQSLSKNPLQKISNFLSRNYFFIDARYGMQEIHSNSYRNIGQSQIVSYFIWKFLKHTKLSIGVITPYQSQRKYLQKCLMKDIEYEKKRIKTKLEKQKSNATQKIQLDKEEIDQKNNKNQQEQAMHPNSKQLQKNQQKSQEEIITEKLLARIMINTVDSFQGQEKDIIIVSTVRANTKGDIGFMKDQRRINVALTRSRHLLIVIGHGDTLGSNQVWNKLLNWHEQNHTYYIINERDQIKKLCHHIEQNKCQEKVERRRYEKLSKDWRKQQRSQIKSSDFGLGMPKKKIKMDKEKPNTKLSLKDRLIPKAENIDIEEPYQNQNYQRLQLSPKTQLISMNQSTQPKQNQQKLLEEKRARQNEAMRLQQMNQRLKELQSKMATENSSFAQLFK